MDAATCPGNIQYKQHLPLGNKDEASVNILYVWNEARLRAVVNKLCIPKLVRALNLHQHVTVVTAYNAIWAAGLGKQPWIPSDRSKVCSLHFKSGDYRDGLQRRRLKTDAIPSIPDYPAYLQAAPTKERQTLKRRAVAPVSTLTHQETKKRLDCSRAAGSGVDTTAAMVSVTTALGQLPPTLLNPGTVPKSSPEPTTEPVTKSSPEPTVEPLESPCLEPMLNPGPVPKPSPEPITELLTKSSPELTVEPLESSCLEPMLNLGPVPKPPLEPSPQPTMKPAPVRARAVKAHGTQTRLSNPRLTRLLKQVKTVTRKFKRLLKKRDELQQMVSVLRKQAMKTEAVMKQGNFLLLLEKIDANDPKALFLQEQLTFLGAPKSHWREETLRNCVLWHAKSPCDYRLLRETGVLSLPSRFTLKRYIGACTGEVVSCLIKQRLHAEAKLHSGQALNGSLMMDEMSLKQATTYQKQSDTVHGLVDLGGAESDFGLQDHPATHLLCFAFVGLSTHYRCLLQLPVGYYFTKALTGEQLQLLALKVMASIKEAGFRVVRLVGDNHSSNCKVFSNLSGGSIVPVVAHLLDEARELYLSFDYCHVMKNVGSQFLEAKRIFRKNETLILPDYLRRLYDLQQRQGAFKMIRCLTKKHL
ncbi:uncharacterized protein LOC115308658, partial [Ixodes scapularis]|uniref:uncharacterized protein LOC115308658 n=1 Tax=Ixodes scapularis TaxID=6945 RepID=UPI001C38A870